MLAGTVMEELRTLFTQIRRDPNADNRDDPNRLVQVGLGANSFYFDRPAQARLNDIVELLARSSLISGGRHPDALQEFIIGACRRALEDGPDEAIKQLDEALASPLQRWTVGQQVDVIIDLDELHIGRSTVHNRVPTSLGVDEKMISLLARGAFAGSYITTVVDAFDSRSDYWRAYDAIEEAQSILLLLSFPVAYGAPGGHFVIAEDHVTLTAASSAYPALVFHPARVDSQGTLWPGYSELSTAARKQADERTDWEARTLGAARWYLHARQTAFPSASLVAGMSALEAVLLRPGERRRKAKAIADRLHELGGRARGIDVSDLMSWMKSLYTRGRDPAAHEARLFQDERHVGRLM